MQRTLTILCAIGILCFVGIWVAYKLYQNAANARRTEKARAASIESKQAKKQPENEPKQSESRQGELFSAEDIRALKNDD